MPVVEVLLSRDSWRCCCCSITCLKQQWKRPQSLCIPYIFVRALCTEGPSSCTLQVGEPVFHTNTVPARWTWFWLPQQCHCRCWGHVIRTRPGTFRTLQMLGSGAGWSTPCNSAMGPLLAQQGFAGEQNTATPPGRTWTTAFLPHVLITELHHSSLHPQELPAPGLPRQGNAPPSTEEPFPRLCFPGTCSCQYLSAEVFSRTL